MIKLENKKFGRLTVVELSHIDKYHNAMWKCLCDCGNITIVKTADLNRQHSTSCGCKRIESCTCTRDTILTKSQIEILEGLIISDGSLECRDKNASFNQKCINKTYIEYIQNSLPFLWNKIRVIYGGPSIICGINTMLKDAYSIKSRTDQYLTKQYNRWYKNKIKIIPPDLQITPLMLKNWFYGDGSSTYHKTKKRSNSKQIDLLLCTDSFTYIECQLLQQKLKYIDLDFNISKRKQLISGKKKTIKQFFDYIGPCDVAGFEYKWKLPKPKGD